jgi:drug/metabolite transporter (DMT)-like permease
MPAGGDWLGLLVLAWGCTVAAYMGYLDALTRVSVFTVNVIYNLEPVYGILLALLFFGEAEKMSPGFYAGAGVIVAVVLALPWAKQRKRSHGIRD